MPQLQKIKTSSENGYKRCNIIGGREEEFVKHLVVFCTLRAFLVSCDEMACRLLTSSTEVAALLATHSVTLTIFAAVCCCCSCCCCCCSVLLTIHLTWLEEVAVLTANNLAVVASSGNTNSLLKLLQPLSFMLTSLSASVSSFKLSIISSGFTP
ncbi:hypothetical protein FF38_13737 [Lucilia cuprina]|uniref:Uncharacterized protein n=1 Tax=Lucilia cuprina TaxID=7375 RepID=A0A0L0BUE8_LUCCU|nr:hypothetical protein FF38_13737 [Lucilia cuprina]